MAIQDHPDFNTLVAWVNENIREGCTRESIRATGLGSGHPIELIDAVISSCYADPAPSAIPWPDISKPMGWAGDRAVRISLTMSKPKFVLFESFISDAEADELIALARPKFSRSTGLNALTGKSEVHPARTSDGMFFSRGEVDLVNRIDARIAELVNWPVEKGEGLQVLSYQPGAEYIAHNDYFDPNFAGNAKIIARGGQRVGTFLIYLQAPEAGGETWLADVGVKIAPHKGNAILFSYEKPDASTMTRHAGLPVIVGEKIVATKWMRSGNFI